MDAALLLILLALRARNGAATGRAACAQPEGRPRRALCMDDARRSIVALLSGSARASFLGRRNVILARRRHMRSAWVRAMCDVSPGGLIRR